MRLRLRLHGVSLFAIVACRTPPSPPSASSSAPSTSATATSAAATSNAAPTPPAPLDYVEIMTGGARPDEREPLVVALHGLGDRPENFVHLFGDFAAPARIVAPHSNTPYSDGYSWFEFHRGDPDFSAPGIAQAAERIAAFSTAVARLRPTVGKPIVVGFSQGGALSFAVAARHADAISAAFPIGGWFPRAIWPAGKPAVAPLIVAFHGAADPVVPIARMRPGAARLSELGFSIDVREFEGVGHSIPEAERAAVFDALTKACERARNSP